MKLLVKYPTRSRPSQFLNTLGLYRSMKSGKHCVEFVVSADANDFTMNNGAMRDTLGPMPDVALCVGNSRTKIEAVNADMEGREFDVLLLASDDMIPVVRGYDDIIATAMLKHFPALDGCLHFSDGRQDELNTLSIMGREMYRRFGYIYHPEYRSLWCDNEFQVVTQRWGKAVFIDECIIRHDWSSCMDELRRHGGSFGAKDKATFLRRQAAGFP